MQNPFIRLRSPKTLEICLIFVLELSLSVSSPIMAQDRREPEWRTIPYCLDQIDEEILIDRETRYVSFVPNSTNQWVLVIWPKHGVFSNLPAAQRPWIIQKIDLATGDCRAFTSENTGMRPLSPVLNEDKWIMRRVGGGRDCEFLDLETLEQVGRHFPRKIVPDVFGPDRTILVYSVYLADAEQLPPGAGLGDIVVYDLKQNRHWIVDTDSAGGMTMYLEGKLLVDSVVGLQVWHLPEDHRQAIMIAEIESSGPENEIPLVLDDRVCLTETRVSNRFFPFPRRVIDMNTGEVMYEIAGDEPPITEDGGGFGQLYVVSDNGYGKATGRFLWYRRYGSSDTTELWSCDIQTGEDRKAVLLPRLPQLVSSTFKPPINLNGDWYLFSCIYGEDSLSLVPVRIRDLEVIPGFSLKMPSGERWDIYGKWLIIARTTGLEVLDLESWIQRVLPEGEK